MKDWKAEFDEMLKELQTLRDELRVKLHLAKADAKDDLEALERKLEQLKARLPQVSEEAAKAAQDVGVALKEVAEQLKKGYERIKNVV